MLTQLAAAGVFQGVRGIAAGQFSDCLPKDPSRPSLSVEDLLGALSRTLAVPFNTGCRFGHVSSKVTIPIGLQAGFDATRGRLTLVCPAVE
jgi:muramoyltetrapeptide carboxypeptidase